MSDEEWTLIGDLVSPNRTPGLMDPLVKVRPPPGWSMRSLRGGDRRSVASASRELSELERRGSLSPRMVEKRYLGAHRPGTRLYGPQTMNPRNGHTYSAFASGIVLGRAAMNWAIAKSRSLVE